MPRPGTLSTPTARVSAQGQGRAFSFPSRVCCQLRSISHCASSALTGIHSALTRYSNEKKAAVKETAA